MKDILEAIHQLRKDDFGNFWLILPPCKGRKISQTPPPYSYVRFHLVFQHNKMLLEKDQLH